MTISGHFGLRCRREEVPVRTLFCLKGKNGIG